LPGGNPAPRERAQQRQRGQATAVARRATVPTYGRAGIVTAQADEHAERAGYRQATNAAAVARRAERGLGRRQRFDMDLACTHDAMLTALSIARSAGRFCTRRAIFVQGNDAKVPSSS